MRRFYSNIERLPRVGDTVEYQAVNEGGPVSGQVVGRTEHSVDLMFSTGRILTLDLDRAHPYLNIKFTGMGTTASVELEAKLRATARRSSRRRAQIRHLADSAHAARMERDEACDALDRAEAELEVRRRLTLILMSMLEARASREECPILRDEHRALTEQLELMEAEGYSGESMAGLEHRLSVLDQQLQQGRAS